MNPGVTMRPAASRTSAPFGAATPPGAATSLMISPSSKTSRTASVFDAGSSMRPFLIRSIRGFLRFHFQRRMSSVFGRAGHEQIKNRHAHGHAVGHLFEHAGLRAVRDVRSDFNAAVHGARMQDNRIGTRQPQPR